jgi:hypothetical protein
VIETGKAFIGGRVQELRSIGRLALGAEQNVEGGGAGSRDRHKIRA